MEKIDAHPENFRVNWIRLSDEIAYCGRPLPAISRGGDDRVMRFCLELPSTKADTSRRSLAHGYIKTLNPGWRESFWYSCHLLLFTGESIP